MHKKMGPRGTAIYLKTCYVLLEHVAGGMRDRSPFDLGANVKRTRRGVPRILPPQHRSLVLQGDVGVIRLWLTLFSLYRVLEFKGTLKLKTITAPGSEISGFVKEWDRWVPTFYDKIRSITGDEWKVNLFKDLTANFIPFIRKAAPNSGGWASVMGLPWDILLFGSVLSQRTALLEWLKETEGLELIWALKALWKFLERKAILEIESPSNQRGSPEWTSRWIQPGKGMEVYPLWEAKAKHTGRYGQKWRRCLMHEHCGSGDSLASELQSSETLGILGQALFRAATPERSRRCRVRRRPVSFLLRGGDAKAFPNRRRRGIAQAILY
jgi:hypothetical protein